MLTDFQIKRLQQTLSRLEQDIPLLNMRVRDLSMERQESARQFAIAAIDQGRQELARMIEERDLHWPLAGTPCEPAD
jgi:hypothetical protein